MSLATFLNSLDAAVYLPFQCCDWSMASCAWVHVGNVVFRFSDDLWEFSCVHLLTSQYHFGHGKLLKATGLRTTQSFLAVRLSPLEYVCTVTSLFSYFQKAQPVLNFTH